MTQNQRLKMSSKVYEKDGIRQFSFFIPGELPGFNEFENEARRNKYQSNKIKQRWISHIANLILSEVKDVQFKTVNLRFTWIEKNKKRDPDNVSAGKKLIIDALVYAGIIENDGWKQIIPPLIDDWKKGDCPGVLVTVREVL